MTELYAVTPCHKYRHQHTHKMATLTLACLLLAGLSGCKQQAEPTTTGVEDKAGTTGTASSKAVPEYDLSQLANADLSNAGDVLPLKDAGQQQTTATATVQGNHDFPLSAKLWGASLIEVKGKNSEHATAVGKVMAVNAQEYCERDPNMETDGTPAGVKRCVDDLLQQEKDRLYSISANCLKKTISTSGLGNFSFSGLFENSEGFPVEPWRNDATGEDADGMTGLLPGLQFKLLCPSFVTWE